VHHSGRKTKPMSCPEERNFSRISHSESSSALLYFRKTTTTFYYATAHGCVGTRNGTPSLQEKLRFLLRPERVSVRHKSWRDREYDRQKLHRPLMTTTWNLRHLSLICPMYPSNESCQRFGTTGPSSKSGNQKGVRKSPLRRTLNTAP
jgi:hypothetical protein